MESTRRQFRKKIPFKRRHENSRKRQWIISLFFLGLSCLLLIPLRGQDIQSKTPLSSNDTIKSKEKGFIKNYFQKGYPSPKKAITLAIIPGLGQIYNKKYWKLPIIYGALGAVIYAIDRNTSQYNFYREIVASRVDDNIPDLRTDIPETVARARRDAFDKNRQLSWLGLIGFYLISAGDAFVDAHLKDFNVDEDISFQPILQKNQISPAILGLSITININK